MKKAGCICIVLLLTTVSFGQSIVSEAKANLEKKHHDSMVGKAQTLLAQKAELESELKEVEAKLAKLEAGQDVKISQYEGATIVSTPSYSSYNVGCGCSSCCVTSTTWVSAH